MTTGNHSIVKLDRKGVAFLIHEGSTYSSTSLPEPIVPKGNNHSLFALVTFCLSLNKLRLWCIQRSNSHKNHSKTWHLNITLLDPSFIKLVHRHGVLSKGKLPRSVPRTSLEETFQEERSTTRMSTLAYPFQNLSERHSTATPSCAFNILCRRSTIPANIDLP